MKAAKKRKKIEPVTRTALVENPNWSRAHDGDKSNPRFVKVEVNPKESGVSALAARGVINASQVAAADRFRALWEALGGSGAGAMDYTKEPVDGGGAVEPISIRQLSAGRDLKRASEALRKQYGEYAYRLVSYIAGEGRSIHELTETRRQRDTMTDNLRTYLSLLAKLWGYSNSAQPDNLDVQKTVDACARK